MQDQKYVNKNYLAYVHSFAPPTKHFHNCLRAFIVGGLLRRAVFAHRI